MGFKKKDSVIQMRYPGVERDLLVGISPTEGSEAQLANKLLAPIPAQSKFDWLGQMRPSPARLPRLQATQNQSLFRTA